MELKNIVPKKRHTNLKKSFCSEDENGIVNIVLLCICAFFFFMERVCGRNDPARENCTPK